MVYLSQLDLIQLKTRIFTNFFVYFISNFQEVINVISIKYKLMKLLNYNLRKIFIILIGITLIGFLNSCGIWDPADARKIPPSSAERVKKNLEEGRGITLGGA